MKNLPKVNKYTGIFFLLGLFLLPQNLFAQETLLTRIQGILQQDQYPQSSLRAKNDESLEQDLPTQNPLRTRIQNILQQEKTAQKTSRTKEENLQKDQSTPKNVQTEKQEIPQQEQPTQKTVKIKKQESPQQEVSTQRVLEIKKPEVIQQKQPPRKTLRAKKKIIPQQYQSKKKTLRMRLKDVFQAALDKNINIQVQRLSPVSSSLDIEDAEAAFDPTFSQSITVTGDPVEQTSSKSGSTTLSKKFGIGATLSLEMSNSESSTAGTSPTYKTGLTPSLSMPLLAGYGYEVNNAPIVIAQKNKSNSRLALRSQVESTLLSVNNAYWNLKFANEELHIQQENHQQAIELMEKTFIMIDEGRLPLMESFQTEAAVSSREEAVLIAQQNKDNAEDTLLKLLHAEYAYHIRPIDEPKLIEVYPSNEKSLRTAFSERSDYLQAIENTKISDINLMVAKNSKLYDLSLSSSYATSSDDSATGFKKTFNNLKQNRSWSVGLTFTTPIPNTTKNNSYYKAKINSHRTSLNTIDLEEKIKGEVRSAIRGINTSRKRTEVTKKARILSEKKLEAEEIKFHEGLSDNFTVITFQNDLVSAKISERKAIKDFQIALLTLKNVEGILLEFLNIQFSEEKEQEDALYKEFKSD